MGRPKQTQVAEPIDTEEINSPVQSPVAPIESVEAEVTDPCWNCGKQLEDNACPECGFDKSLLHNLNLEAERAANIQRELNQKG